jgi:rubredoxin
VPLAFLSDLRRAPADGLDAFGEGIAPRPGAGACPLTGFSQLPGSATCPLAGLPEVGLGATASFAGCLAGAFRGSLDRAGGAIDRFEEAVGHPLDERFSPGSEQF